MLTHVNLYNCAKCTSHWRFDQVLWFRGIGEALRALCPNCLITAAPEENAVSADEPLEATALNDDFQARPK